MERKPKILIVDDDPDFVDVTSRILKARPYEVTTAYNGEEGVRKIRELKPDLILLDIMMPKKDGFIVADEMSRDPAMSNIPILAITSFVDYTGQPFPFKVSEYLPKATKPDDLHKLVEKHLKRQGFFADQAEPPDTFPIPEKKTTK
jgi:two-component system alkaline phosphatase synthesis response regulator PhoP